MSIRKHFINQDCLSASDWIPSTTCIDFLINRQFHHKTLPCRPLPWIPPSVPFRRSCTISCSRCRGHCHWDPCCRWRGIWCCRLGGKTLVGSRNKSLNEFNFIFDNYTFSIFHNKSLKALHFYCSVSNGLIQRAVHMAGDTHLLDLI